MSLKDTKIFPPSNSKNVGKVPKDPESVFEAPPLVTLHSSESRSSYPFNEPQRLMNITNNCQIGKKGHFNNFYFYCQFYICLSVSLYFSSMAKERRLHRNTAKSQKYGYFPPTSPGYFISSPTGTDWEKLNVVCVINLQVMMAASFFSDSSVSVRMSVPKHLDNAKIINRHRNAKTLSSSLAIIKAPSPFAHFLSQ